MVRHKNARFDKKCPTQHASVVIAIIKHPHPLLWEIIFPFLFKYLVFKNPYRNENEIILMLNIYNTIMKCEIELFLFYLWRV